MVHTAASANELELLEEIHQSQGNTVVLGEGEAWLLL